MDQRMWEGFHIFKIRMVNALILTFLKWKKVIPYTYWCIEHWPWSFIISTGRRKYGSSSLLCQQNIISSWMQLHDSIMGMVGNDQCSNKFYHYLFGGNFTLFTDHSSIKYLVKKPIPEGHICRWINLFQEFSFERIVNPRRYNHGLNQLS